MKFSINKGAGASPAPTVNVFIFNIEKYRIFVLFKKNEVFFNKL